jgi:hypothetical protein
MRGLTRRELSTTFGLARMFAAGAALAAAALLSPLAARAQSGVTAGDFTVERPTLMALGFEWRIAGDENRDATVEVTYRKRGDKEWRRALPLFRLQNEPVTGGRPRESTGTFYSYTGENMFAGSILNLAPGTDYECRFVLTDPDGVNGVAERTVSARTRDVPRAAEGGQVYHVYPVGYEGPKQQPAFSSLLSAYYSGLDQSDHANAFPPRVKPGDVILMHAGVYKDHRLNYGGFDAKIANYGTEFDGTYYLTQSGTPDKPIVIKAAGDGEVVFDGDGNYNLFNLLGASYVMFDGITVRNTEVAFLLGLKNITGSSGFTLVHSKIENVGRAVQDDWAGSKDFYIADNVLIGRHDPSKLLGWYPPAVWSRFQGFPQLINSEYAVKVYGQGHVVAYNLVMNWHDGIDIATYGTPSDDPDRVPVSIDFHNNDFTNRQLHRNGRRRAQHPRVRESLLQHRGGRLERAADVRRAVLLLPQHRLQRHLGRTAQALRRRLGHARLPEHVLRAGHAARPRLERPLPQQFVPRRRLGRPRVQPAYLYELLDVRLRRLSAEPGRERRVRVVLAGLRQKGGLRAPARDAPIPVACCVSRRDRERKARSRGRLRRVPQGRHTRQVGSSAAL